MKLKNTIFSRQTTDTIEKLSKVSKYKDMKTFFSIAKLKAAYDNARRPFDIAETSLALELCDKDEKDRPITGIKGEFSFTKNRNEFQAKHSELMDQEVELKIDPIKINLSVDRFLIEEEIIFPMDVATVFGIIDFCE